MAGATDPYAISEPKLLKLAGGARTEGTLVVCFEQSTSARFI